MGKSEENIRIFEKNILCEYLYVQDVCVHGKVKRQLWGVQSLLILLHSFWGIKHRSPGLHDKCFYWQSHLSHPNVNIFDKVRGSSLSLKRAPHSSAACLSVIGDMWKIIFNWGQEASTAHHHVIWASMSTGHSASITLHTASPQQRQLKA